MSRVELQPGWIIHRRPWRESSLLIEYFSRTHGRIGLVARGARGTRSAWRGLAEPFIPLIASWSRRGELGTLTLLETTGPGLALRGRALWCGLYVNELLLRLIKREDAHPEVFDASQTALLALARDEAGQGSTLRAFEMQLLRGLGVAPDFERDAVSGQPIDAARRYYLEPEVGFLPAAGAGRETFSGQAIRALATGAAGERTLAREMRVLMRRLIDHQLAGRPLASRKLLAGLRRNTTRNTT